MKPRHILILAGLLLCAYSMTSCVTTSVKMPDGSETTTTAPDPLIWGRAFDTAEVVAARELHAEK